MKNKQIMVRKRNLKEAETDNFLMETTEAERVSMVWEITKDVWVFLGERNAESRLLRHVVTVERRKS